MSERIQKEDDQKKAIEAQLLFLELMRSKKDEIEPTIWVPATLRILIKSAEFSGIAYDEWKKELIKWIDLYRY